MAELQRSLKAIASDVAEGFITVNPLFLKPFNEIAFKSLYEVLERMQGKIRAEPFPTNDVVMIRKRNMRLQRLHTALMVVKNVARERKYSLFR